MWIAFVVLLGCWGGRGWLVGGRGKIFGCRNTNKTKVGFF